MPGQPLYDNIWTRRGITLLWDVDALASTCSPHQVVSLRRFLYLHALGWPEEQTPLIDDRALVVAGLESALEAIGPDEATEWVRQVVYRALISFQSDVADGGNGAAVILWFTDGGRFQYKASDDSFDWRCQAGKNTQSLPLGRCLFNGAQKDLQEVFVKGTNTQNRWVGLYHPRIS
jgi:hypothetical protein